MIIYLKTLYNVSILPKVTLTFLLSRKMFQDLLKQKIYHTILPSLKIQFSDQVYDPNNESNVAMGGPFVV